MSTMNKKILVVDDDPDILLMLTDRLEALGYIAVAAHDGEQALECLESEEPGLVLLDLEMPRLSGIQVLERLSQTKVLEQEGGTKNWIWEGDSMHPPIIVMTAHGTIRRAVDAMKCGAYDFLTKPLDVDHLTIVIEKTLERESLKRQVAYLRQEVESRYSTIVATTPQMQSLIDLAKRAANSDVTVLLLGENGTGKELFARSIHQWSTRRNMPFVIINCVALQDTLLENELFGHEKGAYTGATALQKGKIEIADGGTLFLDEIGDMTPELQAKLLRLLQDREFHRVGGTKLVRVNIRVLAATNRDLTKAVKSGRFREDLYHRLNVVSFAVPPLRDRPHDIQPLAELFLQRSARELGKPGMHLTQEAVATMQAYSWPGNVRELDNAISRAVVLSTDPAIASEHLRLTEEFRQTLPSSDNLTYHDAIDQYGRYLVEQALQQAGGNQTKAAAALGLQRSYLARMVKQKKIEVSDMGESV
ncbi:MAG: sigma-54-dependent transcriptional regulator [Nitrospirales bacterium]